MSDKIEGAPAVQIPVEHQSAPKKSWADEEVEKAVEEIRTGKFVPTVNEEEFFEDPTGGLAQHPRVQAALARLEMEKREAKNAQEMLEKTQMLYEINERAAKANQWDGQGRWIGTEAEEMRIGLILTPFQFLERLERVIGEGRVWLNRYAVNKRVALLAPNRKETRTVLMASEMAPPKKGEPLQVGTLQYPCGTEWMVMRFDQYGVPTTAKYLGWRTALLSLIQLEVITEKEAHKAFPLGTGPAASWYKQQLFILRAQRGTVQ